jgi:hypothetical protein
MRGRPDRSSEDRTGSAWGQRQGRAGRGHVSQRRCGGTRGRLVGGASGVGWLVGLDRWVQVIDYWSIIYIYIYIVALFIT